MPLLTAAWDFPPTKGVALNLSFWKGSREHFLFFFFFKKQNGLASSHPQQHCHDFAFWGFEDILWDPTHKTHEKKPNKTQAIAIYLLEQCEVMVTCNCWEAISGLVSQQTVRQIPNPTLEKCWVETSWLLRKMLDMHHKLWCKPFALKPYPCYSHILTVSFLFSFVSINLCSVLFSQMKH